MFEYTSSLAKRMSVSAFGHIHLDVKLTSNQTHERFDWNSEVF